MKIIYKQPLPSGNDLSKTAILESLGITGCHFKYVEPLRDSFSITPRPHHHTSCELHLVTCGAQQYRISDTLYNVPAGHYILIPPGVAHQYIGSQPGTSKYSVTFSAGSEPASSLAGFLQTAVVCREVPENARHAIDGIESEAPLQKEYSPMLIEAKILQFLLYLAREAGFQEEPRQLIEEEDPRLSMARQYILDNIDRAVTCPEVAAYCHLSQKQLNRLFTRFLGRSIGSYIRSQKIARIELLLTDSNLSLKQISEKMQFTNEYHFNSFFSKYAGMTPGAYRKMVNHPDYKRSGQA